jgi:16S rRNA (cytidine1402-2'-O)-methyltransferase
MNSPTLYVVGTPIGNLGDFSPRALETLRTCALIAAEDTRVTVKLCRHFGIQTPLVSCHEHNERTRAESIVGRMAQEGIDVALVTDAGMPGISDPGHRLVARVLDAGFPVCAIPGPSAALAALSISGMDCTAFAFYGFLPRAAADLRAKLREIAQGIPIAAVYESPHRVAALLEAVVQTVPETHVCVCSDLTKFYERAYRGTAAQALAELQANPNAEKGEYCLVLDFTRVPPPPKPPAVPIEAELIAALMAGATTQEAVTAAIEKGHRRNEAYQALLRVRAFLQNVPSDG